LKIQKKKLPKCINLTLDSLKDKLFEKESNNNGLFKDFTSIFKTGILLEKILKQSSVILKNLPNLSTAVLERFNDLFNFMPKLTLNEDFCNTFTGKFKNGKEISNFSTHFKVIAISSLGGIRNLSEMPDQGSVLYILQNIMKKKKRFQQNYLTQELLVNYLHLWKNMKKYSI